ncbi:hypothetical protein A6S26_08020 [Nostoc sp. ATCC 43529]|nr:hypothetical protein A6S26_08020 [Nostoc sp. ATCC 43529]
MNNMKKIILTLTFLICSILVGSCSNTSNSASQENKANQNDTVTANQSSSKSNFGNKEKLVQQKNPKATNDSIASERASIKNDKPAFGTIKDMQNGDLKCYVSVVNHNGKLYEGLGATFDVCEPDKYVNKNVNLFYKLEDVNDCQSAEPCGKTIKEWLITKIEIRD